MIWPAYAYGLTFAPDGDVTASTDSVNGNWTYTYDAFNRLVGSNQNSGAAIYSYVYDRFGNRWQQNGPHSMIASFTGNGTTNNNRIDTQGHAFVYDAAGNLLNDGVNFYTYDAENHIIEVQAGSSSGTVLATYAYNADGQRVHRTGLISDTCDTTGKRDYVYDLAGHWTLEVNSNGTECKNEIYAGSRHFVTDAGGTYFDHSDWLGTMRLRNTYTGPTQFETCTSLPFGDALLCPNGDQSTIHFTGKERDSESGLDNFGKRYDSSSLGRFMTTDPVVITTERLVNPQQLNLYAYVANNPLRFIDPTGEILQCVGNADQQKQCFADLQQVAGDAANRLSIDAKTGVVGFDTSGLDLSKNAGAGLVNDLVGSKNTYDFSIGPTVMTDKGPVKIDYITANLPTFGDQPKGGNPPAGVSDIVALYFNNPKVARASNTNLNVAPEWTVAFHELAEAYEKIDGGKGGSYAAGHNAALQRELELRDQRPYLKEYNTGAGGPANSPNPEGKIIIKQ